MRGVHSPHQLFLEHHHPASPDTHFVRCATSATPLSLTFFFNPPSRAEQFSRNMNIVSYCSRWFVFAKAWVLGLGSWHSFAFMRGIARVCAAFAKNVLCASEGLHKRRFVASKVFLVVRRKESWIAWHSPGEKVFSVIFSLNWSPFSPWPVPMTMIVMDNRHGIGDGPRAAGRLKLRHEMRWAGV